MENLKLEMVSSTLSVYQSKGVFCYGTDAVILAKYAARCYKSMRGKKMCDLCSGTGIVPLLLCDMNSHIQTSGLEINKDACKIAQMSAEVSCYTDRYTQYCGDVKNVRTIFNSEQFNFVTCNPPYMTADSGFMCNEDYKTIARHEVLCNINDIFKSAFYLLPTGGDLFIVYRSDRLSSLFSAAKSNRFEIKEMLCFSGEKLPALSKLILCRASKDSKEGMKLYSTTVDKFLNEGE